MNRKGFSLIELLITVAIIGILAAIAVPAYIGQNKKAARTEAFTNLGSLRLLEEQYFAENGCYSRAGGVCANTAYANVAAIQGLLPRFLPGSSLQFAYSLNTTGTAASCFTATATGTAPRVAGEIFTIDCNNATNF